MMRFFLSASLLINLLSAGVQAQSLTISPTSLTFGTRLKFQTDSLVLTLDNPTPSAIQVSDINLYNPDFSLSGDTFFSLASGASREVKVYFSPRHNIEYNTELVIVSDRGMHRVDVKGTGQYPGTYWNATFNLHEEALKTALRTTISAGYTQLGYNTARDWMYMTIDNKKTNGQGASVNTLECVYTGRIVDGYTSRSNAQTNGNLNTEHTWPQSKFGSAEPMQSDLFHLFIVDEGVNSRRSNYPFGVVNNPTWTGGGSLYGGQVFEPRDQHKGDVARAMFYFAIRYQNHGNFLNDNNQEPTLRNWAAAFPPDRNDSLRNIAIFALQKNRNPFIEHPEFLERITSIANNSVAVPVKGFSANIPLNNGLLEAVSMNAAAGDTARHAVVFTNTGNQAMLLTYSLSSNAAVKLEAGNASLQVGESVMLDLLLTGPAPINQWDTVTVTNNAGLPSLKVPVNSVIVGVGMAEENNASFTLYPNPAGEVLSISLKEPGYAKLILVDGNGRFVFSTVLNQPLNEISLPSIHPGVYFVHIEQNGRTTQRRLIVR